MPAYMIVTAKIADRDAFISGYGAEAAKLVTQFGGKYVLRAPGGNWLEGGGEGSISAVISEWPDRAAILTFWNSPEYQAVKKLRDGIADCTVLVIEADRING
jgi:uncharacterized protein (DUF1330 family)